MLTGWRKTLSKFFIVPQRVILSIMGFLAIANAYTMRICLSVAITEMVKKPNIDSTKYAICPADDEDGANSDAEGLYEWDQQLQGIILSSFYWGYIITHLPGGILASKFGGKYTLCLGILSTAIFTILTPICVEWGNSTALIVLRVLMGLGEGTTFPALSALLASWIPLHERSKLGSLVFGGGQVGTIFGTAISGVLLHNIEGWASVFYFFGGLALVWVALFMLLCYSDPESHPFISDSEKNYLQKELGQLERDKNTPPVPWKAIFTSVPMLALICAQIGHDWGFYIMVTDLPKYMSDVLRLSISQNGLFSALPYAFMWIVSISTGFLSDWLIKERYLGITNARKIFTAVAAIGPAIFIVGASYAGCNRALVISLFTIAMGFMGTFYPAAIGPAIFIVGASYAGCNRALVISLFTIAMGFMGTFYPGMKVNNLDLSPNYAGVLMAITNGIGAVTGILAPYVVGEMTPNSTMNEWRTVFWISFVVFISTTIVYVLWASGKTQPWNNPVQVNGDTIDELEPEDKANTSKSFK